MWKEATVAYFKVVFRTCL